MINRFSSCYVHRSRKVGRLIGFISCSVLWNSAINYGLIVCFWFWFRFEGLKVIFISLIQGTYRTLAVYYFGLNLVALTFYPIEH